MSEESKQLSLLENDAPKRTIIRYGFFKKKNRRIYIGCSIDPDGTFGMIIETIRLVGSWKERNILRVEILIGAETFLALTGFFDLLFQDAEFKKVTHREFSQAQKPGNRFTLQTNINPNRKK